jgi:hypothetical protein
MRTTGTTVTTTTLGEAVKAFVPHPLPPADPPLAADSFAAGNHRAEMALARLAGVPAWCLRSTGCSTPPSARKRC